MKHFKYILILLAIPFIGFLFTSPVSAVSDLVYTFSGNNLGSNICGTSVNLEDCQSFTYLYVEVINPEHENLTSASMYISPNGQSKAYPVTNILLEMPSNYSRIYFGVGTPFNFPSVSFKVTLSENNPAGGITPEGNLSISTNGTYDVTNYASVEVNVSTDCNKTFIVKLFESGFWGIATAVVALIVPIVALFLVFRLVHDFFWGRG